MRPRRVPQILDLIERSWPSRFSGRSSRFAPASARVRRCWCVIGRNEQMNQTIRRLWQDDRGQDIAEYAVMLAVILVIVVGTIRLIGSNANNVFSQVASSIQ